MAAVVRTRPTAERRVMPPLCFIVPSLRNAADANDRRVAQSMIISGQETSDDRPQVTGTGKVYDSFGGRGAAMGTIKLDVDDELATLLCQFDQPLELAARELIVLELYRRAAISSGRAAELLGMPRQQFIQHASRLGIPYLDMTADEYAAECASAKKL